MKHGFPASAIWRRFLFQSRRLPARTTDPEIEAYLTDSPHSLFQFKEPVYDGVQVMWQDAAGTIPVTEAGQAVGRVDCLVNEEFWLSQNTSSRRPYWDGSSLVFDGVDDCMQANSLDVCDSRLSPGGFLAKLSSNHTDRSRNMFFSCTARNGVPNPGFSSRWVNDGHLFQVRRNTEYQEPGNHAYDIGFLDKKPHLSGLLVDDSLRRYEVHDGVEGSFRVYEDHGPIESAHYPLTLGSLTSSGGADSGGLDCNYYFISTFKHTPVIHKYQAIIESQPHTFFQFRFPKYAGRQVMWQDAEGAIPVTTIGDQVGRVDCLVSEYYLLQEQSTRRPVWNGKDITFDGVDDCLRASSIEVGAFLHHRSPSGVLSRIQLHADKSLQVLWATKGSTSSASGDGMYLCAHSGGFVQYTTVDSVAPYTPYRYNLGLLSGPKKHAVGVICNGDSLIFRLNTTLAAPFPIPVYSNTTPETLVIGLSSRLTAVPLDADVEFLTIYSREPTPDEIKINS